MTDRERIEYNNGIISGAVIRRGISSVVPFKTSAPTLPNITEAERAVFEKGLLSGLTLDKDLPLEGETQTVPEGTLVLTYSVPNVSQPVCPVTKIYADRVDVDWGDGTTGSYENVRPDNMQGSYIYSRDVRHTYITPGEYTMTYSFTNLKEFGITDAYSNDDTFKLIKVAGRINGGESLVNLTGAFSYCGMLEEIPEDIFYGCPNAENLSRVFLKCTSLKELPPRIFYGNPKAKDFSGALSGLTGLTGSTPIPVGIFSRNPLAENFSTCLQNIPALKNIPKDLFAKNTKVTNFQACFGFSPNIEQIPVGLFANNPLATNFSHCFYGTSITTIPAGLFDSCTNATGFNSCFTGCALLQTFPNRLFGKVMRTNASFKYCFEGCVVLTSDPSTLFPADQIYAYNEYSYLFAQCSELQGTAPPIWTYYGATSATHYQTFAGCTKLSNYAAIPADWK